MSFKAEARQLENKRSLKSTSGAVVAFGVGGVLLVPVQADLLSTGSAGVVPELVISGPAEGVAVVAVVVSRADHAVLVLQLGVALLVDALSPGFAGGQLLLGGHPADQDICKKIGGVF